jgi:Bacterial EndoU nuclease
LEIDPVMEGPHVPGPLVVRPTYDGLGRLIVKSTPVLFGNEACGPGFAAADCPLRDEHYYYDGVRRLKEVVWREEAVVIIPEGGSASGAGIEEPATETSLNPLLPLTIVEAHPAEWEQREYIYGTEYVDEFVCQIVSEDDDDGSGPTGMNRPLYMLQDANYNVVGLARGYSGGGWTPGEIAEQYTFGPYGQVLASETFTPPTPGPTYKPPLNPVGHQGLFFVRFDTPVTTPVLQPAARGLYHVRNRWLDSLLGRFTSSDPNGLGQTTPDSSQYHGVSVQPLPVELVPKSTYSDGMSLYLLLGAQPVSRTDPSGLYFEILGAAGLAADMDLDTADLGMSIFAAMQGFAQIAMERNFEIEGLADALSEDASSFDEALLDHEMYQVERSRLLRRGAIKAGTSMILDFLGAEELHFSELGEALVEATGERLFSMRAGGRLARLGKNLISLPAWSKLKVDWTHILDRHTGGRSPMKAGKTYFPWNWSTATIRAAVRQAYISSSKKGNKGGRMLLEGTGRGMRIRIYFNAHTKTIETAFPVD